MVKKGKSKVDRSLIRQMPLLDAVSNETLNRIEQDARRLVFTKGQEIVCRADTHNEVFILMSGQARVIVSSASGKAVSFRRIDPGDMFGEFSAIDGQQRSASVEAVQPCVVLSMGAAFFRDLMEQDPAFMNAVLSHLVALVRSMTARIVEFSTLAVTNRIHNELLRMALTVDENRGACEISPAPTHSEIAARISSHREAVSREISRLKKLGIVEQRRRALIVKDLERLERMVQDASGE